MSIQSVENLLNLCFPGPRRILSEADSGPKEDSPMMMAGGVLTKIDSGLLIKDFNDETYFDNSVKNSSK